MTSVEEAYRRCEEITRSEARNFFYGIRLLPAPKRSALCALYALARRIDDIGDGDLSGVDKAVALTKVRHSVHEMDSSSDPVLVAVSDTARRYPVPLEAFDELLDGVGMDLMGVSYTDFEELVLYCRRVAGTVGRLCLGVFGSDAEPRASLYADQLGIALQQTNILRDVREDLLHGRVYLPKDELDRFGVTLRLDDYGSLDDPDGRLAAMLRAFASRARDWYSLGNRLLPHLDRRSAACCQAMAGIYSHLLDVIEEDPTTVYDRRLSLGSGQKVRVAVSALAGRR
ncbi:presqualene diphosphate synthase HpnD [Segeticoccus rhizosphaerae]|jgi:phytoene synthase|uniref:presqualene diphosphate synthase HpnD n=1 Tax=Segeticoccus rhizosphaerae TaxID=1104777 RepID=UPI0010C0A673|nr:MULTISPECIES: presqualene diphosphate synthase HpnD [Intrasporangiaceae]